MQAYSRALCCLSGLSRWQKLAKMALLISTLFAAVSTASALPGDLDPSFGEKGKVALFQSINFSTITAAGIQEDGKIVLAGMVEGRYSLVRLNLDGRLDNTFDFDGLAQLGNGGTVTSIAIQADGKIVATGTLTSACAGRCFVVTRFNSDGSLDGSFGDSNGTRFVNFGHQAVAMTIALQPDGMVLVGGSIAAGRNKKLALTRLLPDGRLDLSFGKNGLTTPTFTPQFDFENSPSKISILPDGKFLVVGRTDQISVRWFITRFFPNGKVDRSFAERGRNVVLISDFPANDYATDIAVLDDEKILVSGSVASSSLSGHLALARLTPNGQLDRSFGNQGYRIIKLDTIATSRWVVAKTTEDKIIVGGTVLGASKDSSFALLRLNSDGSFDSTFGRKGRIKTDFSKTTKPRGETLMAVALQRDGKIVAAGTIFDPILGYALAVSRYLVE